MAPGKDGRIQVLSQSAFKRLKEESREKGRKDALSTVAKEAGFTTVEELQKALQGLKAPAQRTKGDLDGDHPPEPKGKPDNRTSDRPDRRTMERWEREKQQLARERDDFREKLRYETRSKKELQQALDAKEAEMNLRQSAVMKGITDVDYALRLLSRHLESHADDEKALKEFDEDKFFEGLRSTHPYLFKEVVRPATTGTGANGAPTPPKPGGVAGQGAPPDGKVDAMKMSREDYLAHLAKRGLSPLI